MNILFLCSATSWGGNEKWTLAAAQGLAARGHRVLLGCRSRIFQDRDLGSAIEYVRFPFANNLDPRTIWGLVRTIRKCHIDVVLPTKQREYLLGGLAAKPFRRVKVVARLGIDRPLDKRRTRFAFRRLLDGVIVNSKQIVDVLARTPGFDSSICQVVYNGIQPPAADPEARERIRSELGIGAHDQLIGMVGRLTYQKGIDLALHAFASLSSLRPEVRLVIVGEGASLEEYLQMAQSLGIGPQVQFTGFRTDVSDILQAIDLFWLTSRSEGMPNALLEAMAAARACVSFDVAGVSELVRAPEEGAVVPFGDEASLIAETVRLIDDPENRQLVEASARRAVETRFSPDAMVEGVERFLTKVLAG